MRMLVGLSVVLMGCPVVSANDGWVRVRRSDHHIVALSEAPFTAPPAADEQDSQLPTDATSFVKGALQGHPEHFTFDPQTQRVTQMVVSAPTRQDTERRKRPTALTVPDRVKRLEVLIDAE